MKTFKFMALCITPIILCSCMNLNNRTISEFDLKNISFDRETYDCVILGGGIGGLTSSIYMSMAGYETVVLQGEIPGGLITQSAVVENWPGEISISGQDLASKIRNQALSHKVKILQGRVSGVNFKKWPYIIYLKNLEDETITEIKALTCIISMGSTPNLLKIPGETGPEGYFGKGVSTCAICDGNLYKNKIIAVVGGGNSAISDAVYLSKLAKKIYIFVRGNKLKSNFTNQEELKKLENIQILFETKITKINGDGQKVTSVLTLNTQNNSSQEIHLDGIFLAIGATPNTEAFKNQITLDEKGYIKLFSNQETSRKGIFAAGDISDPKFKQAITAAGDNAKAALQAIEFLQHIGYSPKLSTEVETRAQPNLSNKNKHPNPNGKVFDIEYEEQFQQILSKHSIVIADFYGSFCIPCQQMMPLFQKISNDFDNIKFVKINVERNGALTKTYSITSVPTFIIFKKGKKIKQFIGARSYDSLKQEIQAVI